MPGVIIDIGTGDGRFVYELAKQHPDKVIIGIDPNHKSLIEKSLKIYKKKEKGGLSNALYVLAGVENLPPELMGVANQIFINFPWGSLLTSVAKVDETVWRNIRKLCQRGTLVDIVFGYDPERDNDDAVAEEKLPELDDDYVKNIMLPKLKGLGFEPLSVQLIGSTQMKDYPSSWAKKLSFGKERAIYHIRLRTV